MSTLSLHIRVYQLYDDMQCCVQFSQMKGGVHPLHEDWSKITIQTHSKLSPVHCPEFSFYTNVPILVSHVVLRIMFFQGCCIAFSLNCMYTLSQTRSVVSLKIVIMFIVLRSLPLQLSAVFSAAATSYTCEAIVYIQVHQQDGRSRS